MSNWNARRLDYGAASRNEVAAALGITVQGVKQIEERALRKLRRRMAAQGWQAGDAQGRKFLWDEIMEAGDAA